MLITGTPGDSPVKINCSNCLKRASAGKHFLSDLALNRIGALSEAELDSLLEDVLVFDKLLNKFVSLEFCSLL